jgi:hypothetical protein
MINIDDMPEITIKLRDPDNQLLRLLDYIRELSSPGHSFSVVVDPDMSENRKSFGIDGDGSFFIRQIKLNKKIAKFKDDKLLERYLISLEK